MLISCNLGKNTQVGQGMIYSSQAEVQELKLSSDFIPIIGFFSKVRGNQKWANRIRTKCYFQLLTYRRYALIPEDVGIQCVTTEDKINSPKSYIVMEERSNTQKINMNKEKVSWRQNNLVSNISCAIHHLYCINLVVTISLKFRQKCNLGGL